LATLIDIRLGFGIKLLSDKFHQRASRKMPGRKMKTSRALIDIFLPDIFLLSMACATGEFPLQQEAI
jgi:hypothetical protein